jgi:hypothetical protein
MTIKMLKGIQIHDMRITTYYLTMGLKKKGRKGERKGELK